VVQFKGKEKCHFIEYVDRKWGGDSDLSNTPTIQLSNDTTLAPLVKSTFRLTLELTMNKKPSLGTST